ncbi:unnamed protein product [Kuraishia capsulata CBS 1993]|uniref:ATP-dependent RNA helicase DBP9 n=1 Tax=Kuraishia capsulata CBS 1993 TaxID=1382522 RepID=W6MPM3_9ASCO|nr:uncharacterized protein KUCA_T00003069001 [Kuraishia capsulata CBS 1993]CDK27092.1 unnamed protein product [Kuraishia capsulata CBS 1993]
MAKDKKLALATAASDVYVDESASFEAFNLDSRLLQAIKTLGFNNPTLIQTKTMEFSLEHQKDVLAKASTGSGKTAAYCIPIIQRLLVQSLDDESVGAVVLVPTGELAYQVKTFMDRLTMYCDKTLKSVNLCDTKYVNQTGKIVISTPSKLKFQLESQPEFVSRYQDVQFLAIDEADLMISYGYEDDLDSLIKSLQLSSPKIQKFLMSATLNDEIDNLKVKVCNGKEAAIIKLNIDESKDKSQLVQYYIKTSEFEKFLLTYVIYKLGLIKGKTLIFVNDIDRGYKLKLFLEQYGIKSCVLNSELPLVSRVNIVEQFNKGVYQLLIATDENNSFKKRSHSEGSDDKKDKEYGASRGVDFQNVACVLNFDLPTSSRSYIHRIGRTARAGKSGMSLSFVVLKEQFGKHKASSFPTCEKDEKTLGKIVKSQANIGLELTPFKFDMGQIEGFRYRCEDGFRAVTKHAVRQARFKEITQELINNDKLKRYFEENPQDLKSLKHDFEIHPTMVQDHLKRVPEYLLPAGARVEKKNLGFISFTKEKKGKKKNGTSKKKTDPLKKFRK